MSSAAFTLSAFGDEITDDPRGQVQLLRELQINYLEMRGAWGKDVLTLDDDQIAAVRRICDEHGIAISCIGSPLGKSPIEAPIRQAVSNLARIFGVADALGTRRVRLFSFYPPDTQSNAHYDEYVEEATIRLARLTEMAEQEGFRLLLENEKEIVGDVPERCHAILSAIDSPHLRFLWDPANFVQVGVAQPTDRGWPLLGSYVAHVHVKDAVLSNGSVRAAGEADGQVDELLTKLRDSKYVGFLALEPHLVMAGHSSGFSDVSGMRYAVTTLRQLMAELGCVEADTASD